MTAKQEFETFLAKYDPKIAKTANCNARGKTRGLRSCVRLDGAGPQDDKGRVFQGLSVVTVILLVGENESASVC